MESVKMEDKVWIDWADKFIGQPSEHKEPLNPTVADDYVRLLRAELASTLDERARLFGELRGFVGANIIKAHAVRLGGKCSPYLLMFLMTLSRTPGVAVMWGHAIARLYQRNGAEVTLHNITNHFPLGFPSSAHLTAMWDAQKIGGANMLDIVCDAPRTTVDVAEGDDPVGTTQQTAQG